MKQLILIRGVPGSGKSTLARKIKYALSSNFGLHIEADYFFINNDGEYRFDPSKIKAAHNWCQVQTEYALKNGASVIVSNTFTQLWEMQPYFEMAKKHVAEVVVYLCQGNFENVHGVPDVKVKQMRARFEYDVSPLFERFKV
jgi:predicted kinase